jgi:hypothetical protein
MPGRSLPAFVQKSWVAWQLAAGAHGTLTGVFGQPGSNADLQHFVTGLEDGLVTKALVELHLPGAPCTPRTPVFLFQLQFKPATKHIYWN